MSTRPTPPEELAAHIRRYAADRAYWGGWHHICQMTRAQLLEVVAGCTNRHGALKAAVRVARAWALANGVGHREPGRGRHPAAARGSRY